MYLRPLEQHGDKFWEAEHIGKWLDAACTMWKYTGDPRIRELMDQAVSRMVAVQAPNGWLGSYDEPFRFYQINWNALSKPVAWDTYYGWDLWCNFTSLEGLLKYHRATTNESRALQAAQRIGDLVIQTFGEGKQDIILVAHDNGAGAMTLLLGFAHLYEATGEPRYLDFCHYLLCQFGRPNTIPIILAGLQRSEADRFPFSKEGAILKHTETELTLTGLCELYRITGDPILLASCQNVYEAGYAPLIKTFCLSGYTAPKSGLEVPRTVRPKVEMCDTPATVRWWVEMFRLTGDVRFLNAIERQVYNQLLAHRTLSGLSFAYMPYQHFDSPSGCLRRYGSLGPFDCCWSMGPIGFCDLARWAYFTSADGLLVNFYESSSFNGIINRVAVNLEQKTEYPIESKVQIGVSPERPVTFALQFRIPEWCTGAEVMVNGQRWKEMQSDGRARLSPARRSSHELALKRAKDRPALPGDHPSDRVIPQPGTLLTINREWRSGDVVTLDLPMPARVTCPIESSPGYCSIERGPLVLAMTERFNKTGDGWCYAAPIFDEAGQLNLQRVQLKDPAGQARVGWQMQAMGRFDISGRIIQSKFPVTLVPFNDAGSEAEPYVAGFPLPKTLESLPPHLGPNFGPDIASIGQGAKVTADSNESEANRATNVIDGKPLTAWRAGSTPYPHWIELRLEHPTRIGRLIIRFGDRRDHPLDFKVLASVNGGSPQEVLSVTGCNLSDYFWTKFDSVVADTLRLVLEKSSGDSTDAPISEILAYE